MSIVIVRSSITALRASAYVATIKSTTIDALPPPFFSLFTECWTRTATFILLSVKKRKHPPFPCEVMMYASAPPRVVIWKPRPGHTDPSRFLDNSGRKCDFSRFAYADAESYTISTTLCQFYPKVVHMFPHAVTESVRMQ